jgi:hypothetical protein
MAWCKTGLKTGLKIARSNYTAIIGSGHKKGQAFTAQTGVCSDDAANGWKPGSTSPAHLQSADSKPGLPPGLFCLITSDTLQRIDQHQPDQHGA